MTTPWPWSEWIEQTMPITRLVPKQAAQALGALRAAADLSLTAAGMGPAQAVEAVVAAARIALVGRRTTFRLGGAPVTLELADLNIHPDPPGLLVGQIGELRLEGRDLAWGERQLSQVSVTCRNVHLRPGAVVTLVAAPVEVDATIHRVGLESWLTAVPRGVAVLVGDDAVARVELRRRGWLGHLEVEPRVGGAILELVPQALVLFGQRLRSARHLPPLRVPLPELPEGLSITGVSVGAGAVSIRGVVREWREPLSPGQLSRIVRLLQSGDAVIDVPRQVGADEGSRP